MQSQQNHTPQQVAAMRAAAPALHNGTYTVSWTDSKGKPRHYTVKVHTARKGKLAGERIISLLTGPDNESSYQGVAFWNDATISARVWSRYRSAFAPMPSRIDGTTWPDEFNSIERKIAVFLGIELKTPATDDAHGHWIGRGFRIAYATNCVVCNRLLTTPESIAAGIGPSCTSRGGA